MKKKIALVTGGYSGEAAISYLSAKTIAAHLDSSLFDVFLIDIRPSGWFYKPDEQTDIAIDKADFSFLVGQEQRICVDAAFICIHGNPGENGPLQGYFDLIGLPYTGCNLSASAITANKKYTTAIAAQVGGVCVANSLLIFENTILNEKEILEKIGLPCFVKPNNGGSSIAMSKVVEPKDLSSALQKAFKEDSQVLIESFIAGREFTIGVLRVNQAIITLPITEIISENSFFDYEAKYKGKSKEITPAVLEQGVQTEIEEIAKKIYTILDCSGIVRIDFILNKKDNQPYLLEVNTIPGQTNASIIPQQVIAKGWTLTDFYKLIIDEAIAHQQKTK